LGIVTAVVDACVLYPAPVRDLLLRLANAGLYRARWSERIHEEWISGLLENRPDLARENLERTRDLMNRAIPDCLVPLDRMYVDYGLPDPDDNHVLRAAITCGSSLIITYNLPDFPESILQNHSVSAMHPDAFVLQLLNAYRDEVLETVREHRLALRKPPRTVEQYLLALSRLQLSATVTELRQESQFI
jgi:hypothetical protein